MALNAMTKKIFVLLGSLFGAHGLVSCVPLTFSHEGVIDFEQYASVYVAAPTGEAPSWTRAYLIEELQRESGFSEVTDSASASVDLILETDIDVEEEIEEDAEGNKETVYEVTVVFDAFTPGQEPVDHGSVSDDDPDETEAIEDALDELAHYFLRPYRI